MIYWIAAGVALAICGAVAWHLRRQRVESDDEREMLSLVAFLKEPRHLEPTMLATAARVAWGADLQVGEKTAEDTDGGSESDDADDAESTGDGFVVGSSPASFIMYRGRAILVNSFPHPYLDDPQEAAQTIPDKRIRQGVADHRAWLSCDAMSIDSFDEQTVREWLRLLGPLLAELLDEDCVAIYVPHTDQIFPNMEETRQMLLADDPLAALHDESPVPVVEIRDDDPRMIAAVQAARDSFDEFVAAFEQRAGDNFSVKAPITANGNTEFIWLTVEAIENGAIYGKLANEPVDLGNLREGSQVRTKVAELNDWAYITQDGDSHGLYTVHVLAEAEQDRRRENDG